MFSLDNEIIKQKIGIGLTSPWKVRLEINNFNKNKTDFSSETPSFKNC